MTNDFDLKRAFDSELDGLEPMPDVVPATVVAGRRSVRRRRLAGALGGVLAGSGLVVGAVAMMPGPDTQVAGPGIAPPPQSLPSTAPIPSNGSTPSNGPSGTPSSGSTAKYTGPPTWFRKKIATELSAVLPDQFGPVTAVIPEREGARGYRVTAGGRTFTITFNFSKPIPGHPPTTCEPPGPRNRVVSCATRVLPNGGRAMSDHHPDTGSTLSTVTLTALIHGHAVELYVFPTNSVEPPLTDREMLDVAAAPRFAALVQEWASHPEWVVDATWPGASQTQPSSSTPSS
ncbi:hypothetical protein [Kribbella deserti]|uniref:DUF3105 domain-containing protein n=1 Tax=Kribbella deserti TaxID=1926257 RepID=A0ABV6QGR7_9ACTN